MTPTNPDISYIVPVYNGEKYLATCLDSILAQQGPYQREIIVVDDASTDGTTDICRRYAALYDEIRVITISHGGFSATRNEGTAVARGEFISYVDADDMLSPQFELTTIEAAHYYGLDIVITDTCRSDTPRFTDDSRLKLMDAHDVLLDMLYQRRPYLQAVWGRIFRRTLIAGISFLAGRAYEDLEWMPRVLTVTKTKVGIIKGRYHFYRDHGDSFINILSPKRLDILFMTDRVLDHARRSGDRAYIAAARERRFSAYFHIFNAFRGQRDVAVHCWPVIVGERRHTLLSRHTRLKSRLGALLSYVGLKTFRRLSSSNSSESPTNQSEDAISG